MSDTSRALIALLLGAFLVRIVLALVNLTNPEFAIQQDNYADYAAALRTGSLTSETFLQADTRLFPGYPILIMSISFFTQSPLVAGLLISLGASLAAIFLLWYLTKNAVVTLLFSFFPPIWVMQATKVATEPITVFLLLLGLLQFLRGRILFAGILIGLTATVRFIAVALLVACIVSLVLNRRFSDAIKCTGAFLCTFSLLFVFNVLTYGVDHVFIQFVQNPKLGNATIGIVQIGKDIFRTIDWGQYRILFSGVGYIVLNLFALAYLYRKRHVPLFQLLFLWLFFSLVFIFSLGPIPLLEEFSRFSVPMTPAVVVGLVIGGSHIIRGIKSRIR
jgi:hypothetical protein